MIHLKLDCDPSPWSAPLKGKNSFYDKKAKIKEFAKWQLKGQYRDAPIAGHVSLDFIFFIAIPKNTSKAMRKQMIDRRVLPTSPDTTNMQKLYEDCLQGIVIDNDRFASKISSARYYSENPGVWIVVKKIEEEINQGQQMPQQHWMKV